MHTCAIRVPTHCRTPAQIRERILYQLELPARQDLRCVLRVEPLYDQSHAPQVQYDEAPDRITVLAFKVTGTLFCPSVTGDQLEQQ